MKQCMLPELFLSLVIAVDVTGYTQGPVFSCKKKQIQYSEMPHWRISTVNGCVIVESISSPDEFQVLQNVKKELQLTPILEDQNRGCPDLHRYDAEDEFRDPGLLDLSPPSDLDYYPRDISSSDTDSSLLKTFDFDTLSTNVKDQFLKIEHYQVKEEIL